ncbi:MAG: diguanylate cyclase, partial [Eubacterium sp.]|nr:diguanylate cyclase [Eubacterium sp.]
MYYSSFGALALVLHLIINHEYLWANKYKIVYLPLLKYRTFVICIMMYYISDALWGLLYEFGNIPLTYADTILYFIVMALSILLWARFVVSYLDQKGVIGKIITYSCWAFFLIQVVLLIVNFFYPLFFEFDPDHGYRALFVRYILLVFQVGLFFLASVYTMVIALRSEGKERIRNKTIAYSGLVMSVFIVLQAMFPLLPLYAIGTLIATCLIYIFVEEDIKLDRALELREARKETERERQETIKAKKTTITFGRIAESLASKYDLIYYVDTRDESYTGYSTNDFYGRLEVKTSGDHYFEEAREYLKHRVHRKDRDRVLTFTDMDYLLTMLEDRKEFSADYRLMVKGKPSYRRIIVRKSKTGHHFVIAYENIDEEVRREKDQRRELRDEKVLARRDELTGTKNKTAYAELEQTIQDRIDADNECALFAIAVCDINDLKLINDTIGHKAGDDYIRSASKLLCDTFVHSPVFRIGGDEFV